MEARHMPEGEPIAVTLRVVDTEGTETSVVRLFSSFSGAVDNDLLIKGERVVFSPPEGREETFEFDHVHEGMASDRDLFTSTVRRLENTCRAVTITPRSVPG
jgi:hypothetical protein